MLLDILFENWLRLRLQRFSPRTSKSIGGNFANCKEHRLPDALFVLYHICNNYIQCRPTVTKSVLYSVVCLGAKVQHFVEVIKAHF